MDNQLSNKFRIILSILLIITVYLTNLCIYYMDLLRYEIKLALIISISFLGLLAILFNIINKQKLFRLLIFLVFFALFFSSLLLALDKSGFWENVSSVSSMQDFVKSQGVYSSLVFLAIQFLQVVAVPIPGIVTITAGIVLFGPVLGSVLSYVGIIIGSIVAFIIGRKFGYKLVVWIFGEANLQKTMNLIKGRDKVIFTMMFLLPFFPDDMLCFVAGLTPMSLGFFVGLVIVTRVITITTTTISAKFVEKLFVSANALSYALAGLFIIVIIAIFVLSIKYGEKIQSYYENKVLSTTKSYVDKTKTYVAKIKKNKDK